MATTRPSGAAYAALSPPLGARLSDLVRGSSDGVRSVRPVDVAAQFEHSLLEAATKLRREAGSYLVALLHRVRVMVTATLFGHLVHMAVNDVVLLVLELSTLQVLVHHDPRDGISVPIEPCEVLNDREIHRDQDPRSYLTRIDASNDIWIRSSRSAEVLDGGDLMTAEPQPLDQQAAAELLIENE